MIIKDESESQPLVSIVMPVFNGEHCIVDGINSVRSQTYPHWELIVIDDGSMDNTWKLVVEISIVDSRIKPTKRVTEKKGAPSCRNIGLQQAKGEYIIFLDADDVLLPHAINQRISAMLNMPELNFGVFLQTIRSQNKALDNKIFNMMEVNRVDLIKSFIQFKIPWQTTAPIWRTDYVKRLDGFNTDYKRMEDPDLHIRALLDTDKFRCFYELPFDCYYSINFYKTGPVIDHSDVVIADAKIYFTTIANILISSSCLSEDEKCKVLADGVLYFIRFHLLKNYLRYRTTIDEIRIQLGSKKLITNGFRFKLLLLDVIYSKRRSNVIGTVAKAVVNRIAFYKIRKYVKD